MDGEEKSLVIFSILGIASAIYWTLYVFFPQDDLILKIGLALNAVWVIGYILVILSACFGGIHLHFRRN